MNSQTYTLKNYKSIPQIKTLSPMQIEAIEVVGNVFPFEINKVIIDELIDWKNSDSDPMFKISFPQRAMLNDEHYLAMKIILDHNGNKSAIKRMADIIRNELDPESRGPEVLEIKACINQNRQAH